MNCKIISATNSCHKDGSVTFVMIELKLGVGKTRLKNRAKIYDHRSRIIRCDAGNMYVITDCVGTVVKTKIAVSFYTYDGTPYALWETDGFTFSLTGGDGLEGEVSTLLS